MAFGCWRWVFGFWVFGCLTFGRLGIGRLVLGGWVSGDVRPIRARRARRAQGSDGPVGSDPFLSRTRCVGRIYLSFGFRHGSNGPVGSGPFLSRTRCVVRICLSDGFRICARWRSIVGIPEFPRGRANTRPYLRIEIATLKPGGPAINPPQLPYMRYFLHFMSFKN